MTIRPAALIVMLSLSVAAAAPLLCEMSCLWPEHAAQSCHEGTSGARVASADPTCDHTADPAARFAATSRGTPLVISAQVLEPVVFAAKTAALLVAHHGHGPPPAPQSSGSPVRAILRV